MKRGDLVLWGTPSYGGGELGILVGEVPPERWGEDRFPHWYVLFPHRGEVLHCSGGNLRVVNETG